MRYLTCMRGMKKKVLFRRCEVAMKSTRCCETFCHILWNPQWQSLRVTHVRKTLNSLLNTVVCRNRGLLWRRGSTHRACAEPCNKHVWYGLRFCWICKLETWNCAYRVSTGRGGLGHRKVSCCRLLSNSATEQMGPNVTSCLLVSQ